jgi:hypothetical protein
MEAPALGYDVAPEIVGSILDGYGDPTITLDDVLKPLPAEWWDQRPLFARKPIL